MKTVRLTFPELMLLVGTRVLAGAGLALLLADKLDHKQRRAVGWTLFGVGALTTLPLLREVESKTEIEEEQVCL